tara:strand:+ start:2907 stop:4388 length:1482 start_codon:yes stop_codon:yes gene_type:complete
LTADQLAVRCERLTRELRDNNVRLLALYADNSVDWLVVDIACQQAGICLVPLPAFFSDGQLRHIFNCTPIDAIIADNPSRLAGLSGLSGQPAIRIQGQRPSCVDGFTLLRLREMNPGAVLPEHTGKITFTSGSTGTPKGVCLSNEQLVTQAWALARAVGLNQPRHLCLLPLSTLLENVAGNYTPLLAGGEVFLPSLGEIGFAGSSAINPQKLCAVIRRVEPNSIILTPQLLVVLVGAAHAGWQAPRSLMFVAVGGSRVSARLLRQAHAAGIPAFEGYGLSECASVVSLNTPAAQRSGSCGKPLPHLGIDIRDGEIVVTGNAMQGYLGEPASWGANAVYTGDIGYLDNEGFLHISGRKKNVLISSYGRNINPEWVESEILANPAIAECVVFGDGKPYCTALISPRRPDERAEIIQEVIDAANSELPDYAQVTRWTGLLQPLATQKNLTTNNGRPRRQAIYARYHHQIETMYSAPQLEESKQRELSDANQTEEGQ